MILINLSCEWGYLRNDVFFNHFDYLIPEKQLISPVTIILSFQIVSKAFSIIIVILVVSTKPFIWIWDYYGCGFIVVFLVIYVSITTISIVSITTNLARR
jgi:hypothetical protein